MSGDLEKARSIILMYHGIGDPGAADGVEGAVDPVYTVDEAVFRSHLALIADSALPVVVPGDIVSGSRMAGMASSVMITFDDGYRSDRTVALPLLAEMGFKGVFFITTGWTGTTGYMDRSMIRELSDNGMTIGSHGATHRFLTDIPDGELADELAGSKKAIEDITGSSVDSFSAPGGRIDGRVVRAATEAGYRWIFSSEPMINGLLEEGIPAGRFAVTTGRTGDWFLRVIEGRPPSGEMMKYRTLGLLKKVLGKRLYESMRKSLLSGK